MALTIKNAAVERLVEEVARLAYRVADGDRAARLPRFLESEVWPSIPADESGRRMTREEEEQILGYDREGV